MLTPPSSPLTDLDETRRRLAAGFPLVNDHPDVAGVLRDPELLALLGPALAAPFAGRGIDIVVASEARGPILGALVARELGTGLVLVRKQGANHPGSDIAIESAPTWRGHSVAFQGRSFDLDSGQRVLLVDDWITTGNTLRAARDLVCRSQAEHCGTAVLVDKTDPVTRHELLVHSLVGFDEITDIGEGAPA